MSPNTYTPDMHHTWNRDPSHSSVHSCVPGMACIHTTARTWSIVQHNQPSKPITAATAPTLPSE